MIAMASKGTMWWQKWGNAAQIAAALIAVCGFAAVLLQLNELRNNNRATSARQVYLAYLDLEFRNPEFAVPDYESIKVGDRATRLRYESFVAYLLYACEEALTAFAKMKEWQNSCESDVSAHLPFLCEKSVQEPGYLKTYNDKTQSFVMAAMAAAGVTPPDCKLRKT